MGELRQRLRDSAHAFRGVFRNEQLRRLELAWAGSIIGAQAYSVALIVFAYRSGGASAVGLMGFIRWIPAAFAAPLTAVLADRFSRVRVMLVADLVRVAAMAGAAVLVATGGPDAIVFALAGFVAIVTTAFKPAESALIPSLARTPEELTAANVASSTIESAGLFAGPALGGLLLAVSSTSVVFAVTAGTFLWSAFLVARIRAERREEAELEAPRGLAAEALAGFRTILAEGRLRLLVGLFAMQTLVGGVFIVLLAVSALELLDLGSAGVGYLNSAVGVGGLLGGFLTLALTGSRRLATTFLLGLVLWGVPILLIGVWPQTALALVLLAVIGGAVTLVDISGITLLQRSVADAVLARVFGVLHSLFVGTFGIGAILAPALISGLQVRGALIATGIVLPVLAALSWRRLDAFEAEAVVPTRELDLLRAIPLFAPLSAPTLEHLAKNLVPVHVAYGEEIFRQGDRGDRFYVIGSGEVEVVTDSNAPVVLGPGGYFGEIALLGDVPRTATVRARSDVELYALEREEFVSAVTGHPVSVEAADAVVAARLGVSPRMAPV